MSLPAGVSVTDELKRSLPHLEEASEIADVLQACFPTELAAKETAAAVQLCRKMVEGFASHHNGSSVLATDDAAVLAANIPLTAAAAVFNAKLFRTEHHMPVDADWDDLLDQ